MKLNKHVVVLYKASIGALSCRAGAENDREFVFFGDQVFTSFKHARNCLIERIRQSGEFPSTRTVLLQRLDWLNAVMEDIKNDENRNETRPIGQDDDKAS